MRSLLRLANIVLGPVLTLVFGALFTGVRLAGREAADTLGGVLAGCTVLSVETVLANGPKHSAFLRRWLDPRAVFEGLWLQEVYEGPERNVVACFSFNYDAGTDSYAVEGNAYSRDGKRWARWKSTHLFFESGRRQATYLWEGEVMLGSQVRDVERSGTTELELRNPKGFALPIRGEGRVSHLGEVTRVKFRLRRLTDEFLGQLGLQFNLRALRIDANDEEAAVVAGVLRQMRPRDEPQAVPLVKDGHA